VIVYERAENAALLERLGSTGSDSRTGSVGAWRSWARRFDLNGVFSAAAAGVYHVNARSRANPPIAGIVGIADITVV
jgi:hypothetical protein